MVNLTSGGGLVAQVNDEVVFTQSASALKKNKKKTSASSLNQVRTHLKDKGRERQVTNHVLRPVEETQK